ncbi:glycoside hydrolase family 1 protein [Lacticaseibacillus kribbianus]|uniref:glycoside hydrolase family 1 protein n=1 Tax=Lacticaseibacillus kribbianus TaxID=2926292 RepID=UPI001CD5CD65|nr:glycoside hydrolase family 1 protein [Lacticaseibacillus kribbianus]
MTFPAQFLWGAATSAYQYEGAATADGKKPSVQDAVSDLFKTASDGYHHAEEDVALMAELGLRAYRFSVAWSRIYPDGVTLNPAGLAYYQHLLDLLEAAHITPVVTLYHFDLPQALAEAGGWANRDTIAAYQRFAHTVFEAFGTRVTYYQTVNEQNMLLMMSLKQALAGQGTVQDALQGNHHLFVAGALAIQDAHAHFPHILIGPAPNLVAVYPLSPKPEDALAANTYDALRNLLFSDMAGFGRYNPTALAVLAAAGITLNVTEEDRAVLAQARPDLLYFNYYNSEVVTAASGPLPFRKVPNPETPQTAYGWDIDPLGLRITLRQLWDRYRLPLMITENGLGAQDALEGGAVHDQARIAYLRAHLQQVGQAIDEGIHVVGYNVWSAIDLVSTHDGFEKRYGLVYVAQDAARTRTRKDSFAWYQGVIASDGETLN